MTARAPEQRADLLAGLDVPRVPQQARSRQKHAAILAAAAARFAAAGYDATTADDICAAAGVSVGTFYSYFRNKRQVFLTLYAACVEQLLALRLADLTWGDAPREQVRAVVHRALERGPAFYGLRRAWLELAPRNPEISAVDAAVNRALAAQMVVAVRRAAAAGLAWPDLDIEATCWSITLLMERTWQTEPGPDEIAPAALDQQRDALAALIYHAIFRS